MNNLSLEDKSKNKETSVGIILPPPPPPPLSPVDSPDRPPLGISPEVSPHKSLENEELSQVGKNRGEENKEQHDVPDDDFGDFQVAR